MIVRPHLFRAILPGRSVFLFFSGRVLVVLRCLATQLQLKDWYKYIHDVMGITRLLVTIQNAKYHRAGTVDMDAIYEYCQAFLPGSLGLWSGHTGTGVKNRL
ncbi:hypothetical protein NY406_07795 [Chlorobaculum sp. MV4-Y]|uniref:hypothetical protein n=1 Tax=Chlorobaculum sp. MV4-Y TaxID=2976335 RepID=UPI0021AF5841|nr:hypothetical protein [Chlorobaculum sp. MV4-Y]UWX57120.1 hypothetical protein NY406_07795 [Chlorobaculum sp. MV4-Y]